MIRKGINNKEGIKSLDLPIWWTDWYRSLGGDMFSSVDKPLVGTQLYLCGKLNLLCHVMIADSRSTLFHPSAIWHPLSPSESLYIYIQNTYNHKIYTASELIPTLGRCAETHIFSYDRLFVTLALPLNIIMSTVRSLYFVNLFTLIKHA